MSNCRCNIKLVSFSIPKTPAIITGCMCKILLISCSHVNSWQTDYGGSSCLHAGTQVTTPTLICDVGNRVYKCFGNTGIE